MIPALFPFSGIPAHLLPETATIVVLVLGLLINLVALGWIPHNRRPSVALAWLLAIFLLPYVGILLFLAIGSAKLPKKRMAMQAKMNDVIRENTPDLHILGNTDEELPEWVASTAALNYKLGALPMVGGNSFEILTDNH